MLSGASCNVRWTGGLKLTSVLKMSLRVTNAGVVLLACAVPAFAVLNDDAPLDPSAVKANVEAMSKLRAAQKKKFFDAARARVAQALQQSGNAGNFVLSCKKDTEFGGMKNGNVEFGKWKTDNRDLFSNRDVERAAELHLNYLILTLKRATLDSAEPLQSDLWTYLNELSKSTDLLAGKLREPQEVKFRVYDKEGGEVVTEMVGDMQSLAGGGGRQMDDPGSYVTQLLNNSVTSGMVARSMGIEAHFDKMSDWETTPAAFGGILDASVRPYLLKKKDSRLIDTWDLQIKFEGALAKANPDSKVIEKFQKEDYPRLLWKKAKAIEAVGLPNRALKEKIAVAKQFPDHPDFDQWTTAILAELKSAKKPEANGAKSPPAVEAAPSATPPF